MKDRWNEENLKEIIKKSTNKSDVLRKIELKPYHGNFDTLNRKIILYGIDISHFKKYKNNLKNNKKCELCDILVEKSSYSNNVRLKERLYKEGYKERVCEMCSQGEEWNGKHMSLILDHINGEHTDNRIENLRIVCPNCNATLSTHGGKNTKNKSEKKEKKCECGTLLGTRNKSGLCKKCNDISRRKVERPSWKVLSEELNKYNYSELGRKYNVCRTTIKGWVKKYKKEENNTN